MTLKQLTKINCVLLSVFSGKLLTVALKIKSITVYEKNLNPLKPFLLFTSSSKVKDFRLIR